MLGIIGAMEVEVEGLKSQMTQVKVEKKAGMDFFAGKISDRDVVVVRSGVGKVNAAICTQILIDDFQVDAVVNTGIAGSLKAEIDISDIVLSTDAIEHDMDARNFGYDWGVIPQMDHSVFVADETLREKAKAACLKVNPDIHVFEGRVVSGDQFISDREKKEFLVSTYQAYCTEMEGAAIAHTADLNGVPFLIIRAISDKADDSASMDYPEFEKLAAKHCMNLVLELVQQW